MTDRFRVEFRCSKSCNGLSQVKEGGSVGPGRGSRLCLEHGRLAGAGRRQGPGRQPADREGLVGRAKDSAKWLNDSEATEGGDFIEIAFIKKLSGGWWKMIQRGEKRKAGN